MCFAKCYPLACVPEHMGLVLEWDARGDLDLETLGGQYKAFLLPFLQRLTSWNRSTQLTALKDVPIVDFPIIV